MNAMVHRTLEALAAEHYRVAAIHLEGRSRTQGARIREIAEIANVRPAPRRWNPLAEARATSSMLLAGVRDVALQVAGGAARALVYLEGDKFDFPSHIPALVTPLLEGRIELNVATRSRSGRASFPRVQRFVESAFDRFVERRTGVRTDCLYGPRAYSASAAARFAEYPGDDWGVLVYPMIAAFAEGRGYGTLEVPGAPPPDYMQKYDPLMRPAPAHLAWRLLQNRGNWRGARAALAHTRRSDGA